jgi:hypothetical protein
MHWLTLTVSGLLPSYCHMNSRLGMSRWMGGAPHSSAGIADRSGMRRWNVCHSSWVVVHWVSWSVVMSQGVGELGRGGDGCSYAGQYGG